MFLAGLFALMLVAAFCSATFGPKKGAIVMAAILIAGTTVALSSGREAVIYVLAYGGGFLLLAAGAGIVFGMLFRKKDG